MRIMWFKCYYWSIYCDNLVANRVEMTTDSRRRGRRRRRRRRRRCH